ncbi:MAG: hypothetical protein HYV34_02820 [Candidatus Kerfeldbacteria bacterium]|nr:hypothetical protein [Candidatus Kerfeldbacteria bacterium]
MTIQHWKSIAASVGDLSVFFGKVFLVTTFVLLGLEEIFPGMVSFVFSIRSWITAVALLFFLALLASFAAREHEEKIITIPYAITLAASVLFWILTSNLL